MQDAIEVIRELGGLAATHELYAAGWDRRSLAAGVRRRELVRVRQGWFCQPGTDRALQRSARVGGRATCRTALRLAGIWTGPDPRLHVAVPAHAVRLRTAASPLHRRRDRKDPSTVVHWQDVEALSRLIVDPVTALRHLITCGHAEEVAASADSLTRLHPASRPLVRELAASVPRSFREALVDADGVCESGIETLVWRRLRAARISTRRQVRIAGVGRVDFVLGRHLVVEVDGQEYHVDPIAFEADRRRDAELSRRGFRVLRFSYRQVVERMPEVIGAILAAVARGDADE
ncbi:endonuclease domain-containing protein [Pseudolysinimonas sp.]|uniref:endonuclease domain-containing protein n=1 Tax=Pseudolysinimonas sp. TaxID=2680009 RepID=UPI003F819942